MNTRNLQIVQIAIAALLMLAILMQNRGAGLSGIFGGTGNIYRTKRGIEKKLFIATIVLAVLFLSISLAVILLYKG
jgi:preprotein translocase subunit SecG